MTYRITFTQHAPPGTTYHRHAFARTVGQDFVFHTPGEADQTGTIRSATVAEDGRSVALTIDLPEQPATVAHGGGWTVNAFYKPSGIPQKGHPAMYLNANVHYVAYGTPSGEYPTTCRAADVTEVDPTDDHHIGVVVKNPTGLFFRPLAGEAGGCRYQHPDNGPDGKPEGGTWHWPGDCP